MHREVGRGTDDRYYPMTSPSLKRAPGTWCARWRSLLATVRPLCKSLKTPSVGAQRTAAQQPAAAWHLPGNLDQCCGDQEPAHVGTRDRPGAVGARCSGDCQHRSVDLDHHDSIFSFLLTRVISKYNPSRSLTRQDWDSRSQYLKIWSGCLVNYLHRPCCQCDGTVFVGAETWECLEVWSGWHSGRVWGGRYLHFITVPAVSSRMPCLV